MRASDTMSTWSSFVAFTLLNPGVISVLRCRLEVTLEVRAWIQSNSPHQADFFPDKHSLLSDHHLTDIPRSSLD
ncbi:hypothetical protein ARMSODRAFT_471385 [Armillaria solidipes]|uniref:Uncharacterized protein n=1 Tax=Armillaria solidipes TaxID=1076256 RepID=A0A2H3B687_9AGAR|nr:hypothetical protein ARMSODRAFT_471385 [Armillaria solidipes]